MDIPDSVHEIVATKAAAALAKDLGLQNADELELEAAELMAEIDPLEAAIIE